MWHSGVCFKRRYVMVYGIFAFFGICRPFSVDLPAKTERVWLFKVPIKERNVPLLISVIIIIALTGLDQLTKHLATVYLAPVGAMPFIPGVMELRYVLNDGAAFSMLADAEWGRVFLIVVTGLALAALGELCTYMGIPIENTVAIGDYFNDIELMRAAGHSVAMGNAPKEVQLAADTVTGRCLDGGVAEVLYGLIRKYG